MSHAPDILNSLPGTKILVVGDVMLDEYVWGTVSRISSEAPVPIVDCSRRTFVPGGAGNVAANVAALDGRAFVAGLIGADHAATQLRAVLSDVGVDASGVVTDANRPTTTKTRIVAHNQQVVRVDCETRTQLVQPYEDAILDWATQHIDRAGALILSDYGKGVVSTSLAGRMLRLARDHAKPSIVDPKGIEYGKYAGATIITPNVHEAERATRAEITTEEDVVQVGRKLMALTDGSSLLITRGADGMTLLRADGGIVHVPAIARSVYDVTGAGDTVVAALALALAVGEEMEDAARLANCAAGVVVGKFGTARVTRQEIADNERDR